MVVAAANVSMLQGMALGCDPFEQLCHTQVMHLRGYGELDKFARTVRQHNQPAGQLLCYLGIFE